MVLIWVHAILIRAYTHTALIDEAVCVNVYEV